METETCCNEGERLDDLQNGLQILQRKEGFRFGMDAVLLAHFTRLRPRDQVADLGTGTGILSLLMSRSEPSANFHAIEWQRDMADMARRSVALNGLEQRISVYHDDLRNAPQRLGFERISAVVCNPPYGKQGSVIGSQQKAVLLARHETDCTLEEVLKATGAILCNQGRVWLAFPAARALELMEGLRAFRLEPKRIQMVCAKASKAPYLLLLEAVKNARPTLHWLPPLIVYHEDGRETETLRAIYGRKHG